MDSSNAEKGHDMKRNTRIAALAAVMALLLTGCATKGDPKNDGDAGAKGQSLYERTITLTDGRVVTCVEYASGYKGGLSCDWDNAKKLGGN